MSIDEAELMSALVDMFCDGDAATLDRASERRVVCREPVLRSLVTVAELEAATARIEAVAR